MERLVEHLAQSLAKVYDLRAIGPEGCAVFLPRGTRTREVPHHPLLRFLLAAAHATGNFTKQDLALVVAGSGLTAPFAWWAARRSGAHFAVYLHGLDLIAPSVIYQRIWLPFIRRADLVLVNSANTRRLAIERGVAENTIRILHPGTKLPPLDSDAAVRERTQRGWGDRPLLLSVGRLTRRKGLAEFIREAFPAIVSQCPDVLLLVIGADASDAVRPAADSEHARILGQAELAGVASAVCMLPHCDDDALAAAYRAANVHVFPVVDLPGDVEGFGMVAIEAAAHGLPTVAFAVGGVPDAVVDGVTGSLVAAGDYTGFATQVQRWISKRGDAQMRARCVGAASAYGWDHFSQNLHVALRDLDRSRA
ncbi:glycosyltransferase family 4 protein [Cognatiluteimonas profundi]|uniref:glycosyltransferase family 4 protein n=1 Tax=Cognatiluteimonas profundi TaxID=2594501 RepID=UPI00131C8228|nr:glycosyltransferase family 4 protein [Lysobacter profundi]